MSYATIASASILNKQSGSTLKHVLRYAKIKLFTIILNSATPVTCVATETESGAMKTGCDLKHALISGHGVVIRSATQPNCTYFVTTLVSICPCSTCSKKCLITDTSYVLPLLKHLPPFYGFAVVQSAS